MSENALPSVFTIEIGGTPTLTFEAQNLREAHELCHEEWLKADLAEAKSDGVPLWDGKAKLRARIALPDEMADRASMACAPYLPSRGPGLALCSQRCVIFKTGGFHFFNTAFDHKTWTDRRSQGCRHGGPAAETVRRPKPPESGETGAQTSDDGMPRFGVMHRRGALAEAHKLINRPKVKTYRIALRQSVSRKGY